MRTKHFLPALALGAVTLAACGGSSDGAATTTTTAPAAAEATSSSTADEMSSEMSDEMSGDDMSSDMSDEMSGDDMSSDMSDDAMSGDDMSSDMSDDAMSGDDMSTEAMSGDHMTGDDMSTDAMAELAAFQSLPLTDTEGNTFTLADFVGQPVFVEDFATFCPNCQKQLVETNAAAAEVGDAGVFLALSIETDLSSDDVAKYASDNGFDNVRFAVMTPEFLAAISDHYGANATNVPSVPHFIIDSHGTAGELQTGSEDPSAIVAAMQAAAA